METPPATRSVYKAAAAALSSSHPTRLSKRKARPSTATPSQTALSQISVKSATKKRAAATTSLKLPSRSRHSAQPTSGAPPSEKRPPLALTLQVWIWATAVSRSIRQIVSETGPRETNETQNSYKTLRPSYKRCLTQHPNRIWQGHFAETTMRRLVSPPPAKPCASRIHPHPNPLPPRERELPPSGLVRGQEGTSSRPMAVLNCPHLDAWIGWIGRKP